MNIDPRHFHIDTDLISRFPFARINYDVSLEIGNTDIEKVDREIYGDLINTLYAKGCRPILVLTHEFWGERQGFDFEHMSSGDWDRFRAGYINALRKIAPIYAGKRPVYQIMNEQDSTDPRASVIVPPTEYGKLFNNAYAVLKQLDLTCLVITGGYNSGAGRGSIQFKEAKIAHTDGIALHPYGISANGDFDQNGNIAREITTYAELGFPLWITEWGVLGQPQADINRVANYAKAFMAAVKNRVKSANWYAWNSGQDSGAFAGYGVVDYQNVVKQPLYDALVGSSAPIDLPSGSQQLCGIPGVLRLRVNPTLSAPIVTTLKNGDYMTVLEDTAVNADGYRWRRIQFGNLSGWIAVLGNGLRIGVQL